MREHEPDAGISVDNRSDLINIVGIGQPSGPRQMHEHRRLQPVGDMEMGMGHKVKNADLRAFDRACHVGIRLEPVKPAFGILPLHFLRAVFRAGRIQSAQPVPSGCQRRDIRVVAFGVGLPQRPWQSRKFY